MSKNWDKNSKVAGIQIMSRIAVQESAALHETLLECWLHRGREMAGCRTEPPAAVPLHRAPDQLLPCEDLTKFNWTENQLLQR